MDNGVGWVMVKYDEISKIRCEQIILLVLPLLCGYKEFSCNNKNNSKFNFNILWTTWGWGGMESPQNLWSG